MDGAVALRARGGEIEIVLFPQRQKILVRRRGAHHHFVHAVPPRNRRGRRIPRTYAPPPAGIAWAGRRRNGCPRRRRESGRRSCFFIPPIGPETVRGPLALLGNAHVVSVQLRQIGVVSHRAWKSARLKVQSDVRIKRPLWETYPSTGLASRGCRRYKASNFAARRRCGPPSPSPSHSACRRQWAEQKHNQIAQPFFQASRSGRIMPAPTLPT